MIPINTNNRDASFPQEEAKKNTGSESPSIKAQREKIPTETSETSSAKITQKVTSPTSAVSEKKEIEGRTSSVWDCLSRKEGKYGGYVYTLRLKDEFNAFAFNKEAIKRVTEKNNELYPAIEIMTTSLLGIQSDVKKAAEIAYKMDKFDSLFSGDADSIVVDTDSFNYKYIKEGLNKYQKLRDFGYETRADDNGFYLDLPDKEAIIGYWETLREKDPSLPKLNIATADGIADDLAFVTAYLNHDVLLSTGEEFVHDSLAHVIPTLLLILDSPEKYLNLKSVVVKDISRLCEKVQKVKEALLANTIIFEDKKEEDNIKRHLEKLETTLGVIADVISSSWNIDIYRIRKSEIENRFRDTPISTYWQPYFEKRFGKENAINNNQLSVLHQTFDEIVAEIEDPYRKKSKPIHIYKKMLHGL